MQRSLGRHRLWQKFQLLLGLYVFNVKFLDLLNCLDDQKSFLGLYVNIGINTNFYKCMAEYKTKSEEKLKEVEFQRKSDLDAFNSVHKQLKPLHGHPNNRPLLDDLRKRMEDVFNEREDKIPNLIVPFQVSKKKINFNYFAS